MTFIHQDNVTGEQSAAPAHGCRANSFGTRGSVEDVVGRSLRLRGGVNQKLAIIARLLEPAGDIKSLGYLVPAALHAKAQGKPVVVSTFTKVLQNQLLEKDLNFLADLVPSLTRSLLKGQANYLSLTRLQEELVDALGEDRLSPARAWTLGTVASFALSSPDGDLEALWAAISGIEEGFSGSGEAETLFNSLRASAQNGREERLPSGRLDFHALAHENATRADIVVIIHSLLFTQVVKPTDRPTELISPFIVCDEAHNLEDAATNVLKYWHAPLKLLRNEVEFVA